MEGQAEDLDVEATRLSHAPDNAGPSENYSLRIFVLSGQRRMAKSRKKLSVNLLVKARANSRKYWRIHPNSLWFSQQSATIPLSESMQQIVSICGQNKLEPELLFPSRRNIRQKNMETAETLKMEIKKLSSQAVQAKLDLHDLSEELPTNWERIPEQAQRTFQIYEKLIAALGG